MSHYENSEIKGLYYIPNYLTDEEHSRILRYLKSSHLWKHVGNKNSRKVIQFGYSYSYDRTGIKKIQDVPKYLSELVDKDRINKYLVDDVFFKQNNMEQLIINKYTHGQGIFDHIDHIKYFGSVIICITIGSGVIINFKNDNIKKKIYVEPKSLYIMSGESRYIWKHGIKKNLYNVGKKKGLRYSLTYRTINEELKN